MPSNNRNTFRGRHSREYLAWLAMKTRCTNRNYPKWHRYGGRGITICDRWLHSFEAFFADVGPKPTKFHTLDRHPDNDGNYEPGNVRWATQEEQSRNRYNNLLITRNNETRTLQEWCEILGRNYSTTYYRITVSGMSPEEALTDLPAGSPSLEPWDECRSFPVLLRLSCL
jgi:hypothetical protein